MREINESQFNEILKLSEEKPILIDFYADWCMPCHMLKPILEKIDKLYDEIEIVKVNVDNNQQLASLFGVMSIPTVVLLRNGKEVDRFIGVMPEDAIKKWLDERL